MDSLNKTRSLFYIKVHENLDIHIFNLGFEPTLLVADGELWVLQCASKLIKCQCIALIIVKL